MVKTDEERASYSGLLLSSAMGGIIATIILFILLFAFAILVSEGKISESISKVLAIASAFIGASAGGFVSARRQGRAVLVSGISGGIAFLVIILIIIVSGADGGALGITTLKLIICAVAGGAFGGALCSGKKKKKRRHHSK